MKGDDMDIRPETRELIDGIERGAAEVDAMPGHFEILKWGLLYAQVCTDQSIEEASRRLNRAMPSGTTCGWVYNAQAEPSGDVPCQENPAWHHYMFNC